MKAIAVIGLVALLTIGVSTRASSQDNSLGVCLVDSLNGKERKRLARWTFFSIAAHPEINPYFTASEQDIDSNDQYVGRLVTRLFTEDCPMQIKAAAKQDPRAVEKAFALVGQVAMQELMTNQQVMDSIANYGRYVDQEKVAAVLSAP